MALHDAFLADIIEHPDDDAPRLVFADWLEDNGEPERADFIRVQCELARLEDEANVAVLPAPAALARSAVLARQADLLRRHEGRWSEPLRRLGAEWWTFHRGFIEAVALQAEDFVSESARLFAAAPVRDLTLFNVQRCESRLPRCREIDRPAALRLTGYVNVDRLFKSRFWLKLRTLELREPRWGSFYARALAVVTTMPVLIEVGLPCCNLDRIGLDALAHSPLGSQLEAMNLRDNNITDDAAYSLARAPLGRLSWVNLERNPIGEAGITALLDSSRLTALRHILCEQQQLAPALRERLANRAASGGR